MNCLFTTACYNRNTFGEALKKKCNIFYIRGGGQDWFSLHFFSFQKHGLKLLNIAFLRPYFFFLDFRWGGQARV